MTADIVRIAVRKAAIAACKNTACPAVSARSSASICKKGPAISCDNIRFSVFSVPVGVTFALTPFICVAIWLNFTPP
jgi:hypothetical protein